MQSEYKKNFGLYANKMGMVLPGQPSISTSTGKIEAWDSLDHYATLGFFGRFNYDYKSRYLFEFDLRRDGSSRYAKGHQWGTFPAFPPVGMWLRKLSSNLILRYFPNYV